MAACRRVAQAQGEGAPGPPGAQEPSVPTSCQHAPETTLCSEAFSKGRPRAHPGDSLDVTQKNKTSCSPRLWRGPVGEEEPGPCPSPSAPLEAASGLQGPLVTPCDTLVLRFPGALG